MTQFVQVIILGLLIGGVYALLAAGLTLIFGVMDVINVAQGALLIFAAFVAWTLWHDLGIDPLLGVLITTPLMFGIGWVIYMLTIQFLAGKPASMSVLLTFALALVIEGVMGILWSTTYHAATPGYFAESYRPGDFYLPKIVSVLYPFLPGSHYQWISRLLGVIVLGGMGSLPGAVGGALALGVAETTTATYISPRWATMVPYALIIVVLLARPQGLMGTKLREDAVL